MSDASAPPLSLPAVEMMPTVIHNEGSRIVTLNVLVAPTLDGKGVKISAAPVALPQKDWLVRWVLMVSAGITAEFTSPGILIATKDLPPMVQVSQPEEDQKDQCTRQIVNAARSSNQFSYLISINWKSGNTQGFRHVTVHDPTISVTQDPVDGWLDHRGDPASA